MKAGSWRTKLSLAIGFALCAYLTPASAGDASPGVDCDSQADSTSPSRQVILQHAKCLASRGSVARAWLLMRRLPPESLTPEASALLDRLARALGLDEAPRAAVPAGHEQRSGFSRKSAYIAAAVGHDTNITRGTDVAEISVPGLGNRQVALPAALTAIASDFMQMETGADLRFALSQNLSLFGMAVASVRLNTGEKGYAPWDGQLAAGVEYRGDAYRFVAESHGADMYVGKFLMMTRRGILGLVEFQSGRHATLSMFGGANRHHYPLFMNVATHDEHYGVAAGHPASGLRIAFLEGAERADGDIKDLDRNYRGWKLTWSRTMADGEIRAWLSQTESRHDRFSPVFLATRTERTREWGLEWTWRMGGGWSLKPRLQWEHGDSTLPLTRLDRRQRLVVLRRDF